MKASSAEAERRLRKIAAMLPINVMTRCMPQDQNPGHFDRQNLVEWIVARYPTELCNVAIEFIEMTKREIA